MPVYINRFFLAVASPACEARKKKNAIMKENYSEIAVLAPTDSLLLWGLDQTSSFLIQTTRPISPLSFFSVHIFQVFILEQYSHTHMYIMRLSRIFNKSNQ